MLLQVRSLRRLHRLTLPADDTGEQQQTKVALKSNTFYKKVSLGPFASYLSCSCYKIHPSSHLAEGSRQCVLDTFPAAIQLHYLSIGQCPTLVVLTFVSSGFFVKISNKRSLIRCAPPEVEHPTLFLLCTWWTMCGAPLHIHSKHMMHLLPLIHTDSL